MKKRLTFLFLAAIAAMCAVSCNKDIYGVPVSTNDFRNFDSIIENAEPVETFSVTNGDYELVVTGATEAHSHEDVLSFKAVLKKYNEGVLVNTADITGKCAWGCEPWGYATPSSGKYTSVYKGTLKSKNSELPIGMIARAETKAVCSYTEAGNKLSVSFPIVFDETIHIGFNIKMRRTVSYANGKWEFQAEASYPVPFMTNVIATCGYGGLLNWQIYPGKTYVEYLTDPNQPVNSENEARESKVDYVVFNDKDKSTRYFDKDIKRAYHLHAFTIE